MTRMVDATGKEYAPVVPGMEFPGRDRIGIPDVSDSD